MKERQDLRTAFLLGAGLGVRMRPLTDDCPKPLLPVSGRPLITYAMDHLLGVGIERFIVNTHHCAEAYDRAFPDGRWRGVPITFRHEPTLLDTGGGLKNIEDLLGAEEMLLVYNGDILTNLPLAPLIEAHMRNSAEASLVLRSEGPLLNVSIDETGAVCDLRGRLGNPGRQRCQFTGICMIRKRFLNRLIPGRIESVVEGFLRAIRESPGSVAGVLIDEGSWRDIGSPEEYAQLNPEGPQRRDQQHSLPGEAAREWIAQVLPAADATVIGLEPFTARGSDRAYWRVRAGDRGSFVFMHYELSRRENAVWEPIGRFLATIGIPVPRILAADSDRRFVLLEDLGNRSLESLAKESGDERIRLYAETLRIAHRLHSFPLEEFRRRGVPTMEGFSPELYRWEQDYFLENFVRDVCGIDAADLLRGALGDELRDLSDALLAGPPGLVHRDLQSQNVMIRSGSPVLIDFQGMRIGNPLYDLGSLLCDPYVAFEPEQREALLRFYHDLGDPRPWPDFRRLFYMASVQRLLQALGAYGCLALKKNLPEFRRHIPRGVANLLDAAECAGNLSSLSALVLRCRENLVNGSFCHSRGSGNPGS
jgi:aminoglycoside/choline kinase family phosphotransferase/choline kinase